MPTIARRPYGARRQKAQYDAGALFTELLNIQQAIPVAKVRTVVGAAIVQATDDTIAADAAGGAFAVTLPPADQLQFLKVTIKRINSGANAVTVSGTIDGGSSVSLSAQWKAVTLQSNGVDRWLILSTF